jgi:hypothetical protein
MTILLIFQIANFFAAETLAFLLMPPKRPVLTLSITMEILNSAIS